MKPAGCFDPAGRVFLRPGFDFTLSGPEPGPGGLGPFELRGGVSHRRRNFRSTELATHIVYVKTAPGVKLVSTIPF